MKLLITGDHHFDNYSIFEHKLQEYIGKFIDDGYTIQVMCDHHYEPLMKQFVTDHGYESSFIIMCSKLTPLGKREIVKKIADCSLIFSDGLESEISDLIEECQWHDHKYRVINYVQ